MTAKRYRDSAFPGRHFLPWIGRNYDEGFRGLRTLVLGDSHYLWEDAGSFDERCLTRWTVQDWIRTGEGARFFKPLSGILGSDPTDEDARTQLWNSLAFANFVQTLLPDRWATPNAGHFHGGGPAFSSTLAALRPECVLVFSCRCFDHLPPAVDNGVPATLAGQEVWVCAYRLPNGGLAHAFRLPHPSRSSAARWGPAVHEAIEYCVARR